MPGLLLVADFLISILILAALVFARIRGRTQIWQLFWLGFFVGLVWELAFFFNGPLFSNQAVYQLQAAFPLHPALQPLAHSVWDGALFLVGVGIVRLVCRAPCFQQFRFAELLVFMLWANIQELIVELLAMSNGLWTFTASPYNYRLFSFGHGAITLLPQLVWTIGVMVYYPIVLRIQRHSIRKSLDC